MSKLLDKIIDTYGGQALWESINSISVAMVFGGLAFSSRFKFTGNKKRFITVFTKEPRVIFQDYPNTGKIGVFTKDRVWIESSRKEIIFDRNLPREAFQSFRRSIWWDDLDLLYFSGYAIWNYLTTPFLLLNDGIEVIENNSWFENKESWQRFLIRFPASIPTHSKYQTFYFDENYLLRRHDYNPIIFAKRAMAVHYSCKYRSFDGLLIPTRRFVVPNSKTNKPKTFPKLVFINIDEVKINYK